jgi:hypothetical protein
MDAPAVFVTYYKRVRDPKYKSADINSIPLIFRSKLYQTVTKKVKITNPTIVNIVNKAEGLGISPYEAEEQLREYLIGEQTQLYLSILEPKVRNKVLSQNKELLEAIQRQFDSPTETRVDPLFERYVEAKGLSGRFTPEDERRKLSVLREPELERNKKSFCDRGCR